MIGQSILHYKVIEKLGGGGMGVVYKAEDTRLDRLVALKFLPPHLVSDPEANARFIREAKAASALDHPHICTIHDIASTDDGKLFIVMAYYQGQTLKYHIREQSKPLEECLNIVSQIAEGLARAHEAGIVHRDIKPANVMVTDRGQVKILDFGLAKLSGAEELTKEYSTLGTAAYMSPEQAKGEDVDHRSDIWSLGVVFYELLSGERPFKGEYEQAILYAITHGEAKPVANLRPELTAELETVVNKCLQKAPADRYQQVADMAVDLSAIKKQAGTADAVATFTQKKSSDSKRPYLMAGVSILLGLLILLGVYFWPERGAPIDSIAVLPFANANNDQNIEYLGDGLAETLINKLSRLPQLKVMARSTVFYYKGKGLSPLDVGRELGVKAVLAGNIVQRGDVLVLQAEVVNIDDGTQIWGEQYQPTFDDLISVQNEISAQITQSLRLTLSPEEERQLERRYTENTEAYQLYLKGRYHWNKRTADGFERALGFFQQAIELDPDYALAYAGLADCYALHGNYEIQRPMESLLLAKKMALKALELDDQLGEAYTTLGYIKAIFDWDWTGAEESFRTAILLNPNYATVHHWYSDFLMIMGRIDEAILQEQLALQVDPLSLVSNTSLGYRYWAAGKNDLAIEQIQRTLEIDPDFHYAHGILSKVYMSRGELDNAVKHAKAALRLENSPRNMRQVAMAYAMTGKEQEALEIAIELEEMRKQRPVDVCYIAEIYASLGDIDKVIYFLEIAVEERSSTLPWWNPGRQRHLAFNRKVVSDSRFKKIANVVGWPK